MLKELDNIDIDLLVSKEELLKEMFIANERWEKLDNEMNEYGYNLRNLGLNLVGVENIEFPTKERLIELGINKNMLTLYLQHERSKGIKPEKFPTSQQLKDAEIDIDKLFPNHQIETRKFVELISLLVKKLLDKRSINNNPTNIDNEDKFQSCIIHILKAWRKFDFKTRKDPFGFFTTCCKRALAACFEELYQRKKNVQPQIYTISKPKEKSGIYNTLKSIDSSLSHEELLALCKEQAPDEARLFIDEVESKMRLAKTKFGHSVQDIFRPIVISRTNELDAEYTVKVNAVKAEAVEYIKQAVTEVHSILEEIDASLHEVEEYRILKSLSAESSHTEVATSILAFVKACKEMKLNVSNKVQRDLMTVRTANLDNHKLALAKRASLSCENKTLQRQIPSWIIEKAHYRVKVGSIKSKWVNFNNSEALFVISDSSERWVLNEDALANIYFKLGKFDEFEIRFALRSNSANSVSISYCSGDGESGTLHNL